jgi:hypothetical protein
MTRPRASRTAGLLLALLGLPAVTHGRTNAQELPVCEAYNTCALRVQYRLLGTEIVRGAENTRVARIGWGTPPLEELFARSDQATTRFDRFRTDHGRASWLAVLGGIEIIGGLVARSQGADDWALGLSISGVAVEVAARIFSTRADEHLSQAIWWYNASLAEGTRK